MGTERDWYSDGRSGSEPPSSTNTYGDDSYARWRAGVEQRKLDEAVTKSFETWNKNSSDSQR